MGNANAGTQKIESKTKAVLGTGDINRVVRHVFGDLQMSSIRELKDGWFNRTYHIALDGGRQHSVLKLGPPHDAPVMRYEADILRAEVGAMRLVASNPLIPVPTIIGNDFSRSVLPFDYYFMDFIEGGTWQARRATLGDAANNRLEFELGQITAQINGFKHDTFGLFAGQAQYDCWFDAFYAMCENLFLDASQYAINLEIERSALLAELRAYHSIFDEVEVPQLVHWDLWHGNVFVGGADEPHISGVIDFERALWGDPLMEVFLMSPANATHYIEGYGQNLFATREARLRRIFYNIYLDLVMIIEDGPRQYDDRSSVLRGRRRLPLDLAMLKRGDLPVVALQA